MEFWITMLLQQVGQTCCTNLYQHICQSNESTIAEFTPMPKLVWNVDPTSWYNKPVQHVGPTLHIEFAPSKLFENLQYFVKNFTINFTENLKKFLRIIKDF